MEGKFNYVQESLEYFPKLTSLMFGWEYNMAEIEKKVSNIKENDRLESKDLLSIRDAKEWNYKRFWPNIVSFIDLEQPINGIFKLGWEGRKKTISTLYKKFLNIEVVSVILRFVDPQNYAIISPPVENFFSLQPKDDHVEYYIHYLTLLKKTSRRFQMQNSLAKVDMALWSLTYILKNWSYKRFRAEWTEEDKSKIELIIHIYNNDMFFRKMRLIEALKQAYQDIGEKWGKLDRIVLADCLDSEVIDPELAMIIISYSFENFLWKIIEETGEADKYRNIRPRRIWIDKLSGKKIQNTSQIFYKCLDFRDRSVHPWLKNLSPVEREEFICNLEKLILKKKGNNL